METSEEKDKLEEKIVAHGLQEIPLTSLNKDKAVEDILIAEVLVTRTLAIDHFVKGLNHLGLGRLLQQHPNLAKEVLPSTKDVEINPTEVKAKFKHEAEKSELEERVISWFMSFIEESSSLQG